MGIVILLVVGGIIGWLASIVMRTDGQQGIALNIVVGIVGSLLGGGSSRRSSAASPSPRARSTSARCWFPSSAR